jgi:hypothetical protein
VPESPEPTYTGSAFDIVLAIVLFAFFYIPIGSAAGMVWASSVLGQVDRSLFRKLPFCLRVAFRIDPRICRRSDKDSAGEFWTNSWLWTLIANNSLLGLLLIVVTDDAEIVHRGLLIFLAVTALNLAAFIFTARAVKRWVLHTWLPMQIIPTDGDTADSTPS